MQAAQVGPHKDATSEGDTEGGYIYFSKCVTNGGNMYGSLTKNSEK